MIVVAIIGLLAIIAVPAIYSARTRSQAASCTNQLRQISAAKDQWALKNGQVTGTPNLENDLVDPYMKRIPICPSGGTYNIDDITVEPTCSVYDAVAHPATL